MDKIEELKAMFGQAEEMKAALDCNTKEIAEEIRCWCVDEAHRLESLRKELCDFVFSHMKELTERNVKNGFHCVKSIGPICYEYSNGTISFELKHRQGIAVGVSDIGAKNDNFSKVGIYYSELPKPRFRFGWNFGRIFGFANAGKSDVDFWVDAKLWLAIENEQLNYFADELKKVVKELVDTQNERFDRISEVRAEVVKNPKTMKVILEIRR